MVEEYDEKICGACKSAIRKISKSNQKYWKCLEDPYGRSCAKCYMECHKYAKLKLTKLKLAIPTQS